MLPDFRVRQRDYLLEISRALTSRLDLNEVLRLILQLASELLNGQAGLIALVENERYRIRTVYGVQQPILDKIQPMLAEINDVREAEDALRKNLVRLAEQVGLGFWQIVWLPLQIGDDFLGAIYVFRVRGGEFSGNDRRVLQSFADQAAIAVNNAQLYQQLNHEKRRLNAMLENSADGVALLDGSHTVLTFNQTLASLAGTTPEHAIGRRFEDIVPLTRVRAGQTLESAEADGWPLNTSDTGRGSTLFVDADLQRPNGSSVPVEINYTPLLDTQGRLLNVIVNVHDLTRFRAADEIKNTFISAVSHELRTPVALIKGYASTLRRPDVKWDAVVRGDSLKIIEDESDRLSELIDNLLDASRAQAGDFKLRLSELDLDEVVKRVVDKFTPQLTTHTLTSDVPSDLPMVMGDDARITQVLNNLIANAAKYAPAGTTISVSGRALADRVEISVTDQGPGITPADQARIFERFYRTESAVRKSIPGTGLGLYLCKSIIEAHGGNIRVESDGAHGSTFRFQLPRTEAR
jgi:PAS domain S-box-containing protein